jgi:tol-pal system protein YbgF
MPFSPRSSTVRRLALGALFACLASTVATAQSPGSDDAPSWLDKRVESLERGLSFFGREDRPSTSRTAQPAQSSMADISVRLDRLENQMRQLNGRLEELQYQGRRNEEQLKRFQGDVDFRIQDLESGKGGGSSASRPSRRTDADVPSTGASGSERSARVGDSGLGSPPASLGQTRTSSADDAIAGLIDEGDDPNAPMSIRPPGAGRSAASGGDGYGGGGSGAEDRMAARSAAPSVSAGTGSPSDQFALGVGFVQRRDYGQAEATFRDFLRSHPSDAKAPEARYWLGESLYQRRKYTDAADSFFTIYKDAPQSSKAPESMLKLGMSLNGMGKKEEACATIAEAGRKYSRIKAQSDRELKRISC